MEAHQARRAAVRYLLRGAELDALLVTEMIGYDSSALSWQRPATGASGAMSSSRFDSLFVTQND